MDQQEFADLVKDINARTLRIEQILPTLTTKDDLKPFATKDDVREEAERTRQHFNAVAERVEASVAVIAEGHEVTKARVDGVRAELREDLANHEVRITKLEADASKRR